MISLRIPKSVLGTIAALTALTLSSLSVHANEDSISGLVGVGTWSTQAEFKDIKVTKDGKTLFESDFSRGMQGWKTPRGHWEVVNGALRQTSSDPNTRALIGDPSWSDYTLTLKARKLGGAEGFLVLFGMPTPDARANSWWNLGGWGNTAHGIQSPQVPERRLPGSIVNDRWYDIKIELEGNTIRAYIDNQLVQTVERLTDKDAHREFPHALIPDMLADASIIEENGTFYCYATTDGMGHHLSTSGLPVVWKSKDFLNWSFEGSIYPDNFDAKYWAPSAPFKHNGRYYLFPTLDGLITATVSDSLTGPFKTLDGKDIYPGSGWKPYPIPQQSSIDAEIFRDDDGTTYMFYSRRRVVKLKSDLSGPDGRIIGIDTGEGNYSEGPWFFKRKGIYYYLYTLGGGENYSYAYVTSRESPTGPWTIPAEKIIAQTDTSLGIYGPGHGCFFNPEGTDDWYFVHLEYGRSSTNRQIVAQKMHFNPDGSIQPIQLSLEGVGAIRNDPVYASPNLALGAKASASSTQPDFRVPGSVLNRIETFEPAKALDGSNGSRWMAVASDAHAWYQLDLGKVCDIERTELYFVKPTVGHAYRLESSVDGRNWKPCGGHADIQVRSPHTDSRIGHARYLKLTLLQGTPGLWEFRVY